MNGRLQRVSAALGLVAAIALLAWAYLLGPWSRWTAYTYSSSHQDAPYSLQSGESFWARTACLEEASRKAAEKLTVKLYNESREGFSLAPGEPDPDEYAVLSTGFCGKGCMDWSFSGAPNALSCWSRVEAP